MNSVNTKLTPAMLLGLDAVARGEVRRVYNNKGNVIRCPKSMAATTFRRLELLKLIAEGNLIGKYGTACPMGLTLAGVTAREASTK